MKTYLVEIPVVLRLMVEVQAENKEEAKEKVFNSNIRIKVIDENNEFKYVDYEWEMYEKVVQGNVYYGGIDRVDITEMKV